MHFTGKAVKDFSGYCARYILLLEEGGTVESRTPTRLKALRSGLSTNSEGNDGVGLQKAPLRRHLPQ